MTKEINIDELAKLKTGKCNIIAVVKFFKPSSKTRGSGFSQFISVTDQSLQGEKFPITLMHDNPEKFPPIKSPGDILIMHRLVVSSFRGRLQGVGYGSAGFAAAVFPGDLDAELKPSPSKSAISYSDDDLEKVKALKVWYHSPDCPVEKETIIGDNFTSNIPASLDVCMPPAVPSTSVPTRTSSKHFGTSRLHSCQSGTFYDFQAQILSIYEGTGDGKSVILYVWDGEPSWGSSSDCKLPFHFHRQSEFRLSRLDPVLAATTGHRVLPNAHESSSDHIATENTLDWSVPIYLFDEYVVLAKDINPGDYLHLTNVHCLRRSRKSMFSSNDVGTSASNASSDVRLLSMHGGGRMYGRNIEVIHADAVSDDLKCRLDFARNRRQYLAMPTDVSSNDLQPITIHQLSQIPIRDAMSDLNTSQSFLRGSPKKPWATMFSIGQPLPYHTVRVRMCARVLQVYPRTEDQLRDCLMIICHECAVANRLSCLQEGGILDCDCQRNRRAKGVTTEPVFSVCPIFTILLADATGQLGTFVIGDCVEHLLDDHSLRKKLKCLISSSPDTNRRKLWNPFVDNILQRLSRYESGWVDVVLLVCWKYREGRDTTSQNSTIAYFSDCHWRSLK